MNTLLADPPAVADTQQPSADRTPGVSPEGAPEQAPTPARACANCGAALGENQDWCLQCGAGAPGSLTPSGPGWRSAATILAAAAALAIGAAAAAYAALSEGGPPKPRPVTATVAQTTPPVTPPTTTPTTPGALTPPPTTPKLPGVTTPKSLLPKTTAKPPKIPLATPTPKATPPAITPAPAPNPTTTPKASKPSANSTTTEEEQPQALTLDTNAAATYNPYNYPASDFGDPSLAIDGEPATGWTAQVEPSVAPKMAVGLVIDLKSSRRLSALTLITSTPGMTVQVYGAAGGTAPPTSITDPAWTRLSPALLAKKRETKLKLKDRAKAFRFVTLWISKAPASAVGTPQEPGHVSVNEIELFPAK
jgi:hypothetical protein